MFRQQDETAGKPASHCLINFPGHIAGYCWRGVSRNLIYNTVVMRTITIRVPDYVYETVRDLARKQGVSINQYAYLVLAERTSRTMAQGYRDPDPKGKDRVQD